VEEEVEEEVEVEVEEEEEEEEDDEEEEGACIRKVGLLASGSEAYYTSYTPTHATTHPTSSE
jgi:hypothetical protein